ncbi:MAG: hypothetical protein AAFU65_03970 [Pseudomonadota bacterium]
MFGSLKAIFGRKNSDAAVELPEIRTQASEKLSTVPRMEDQFPSVRHLAVNLVISAPDHETEPTMNGRSFGPQALAYFEFRCKNVECAHGGFDITDTITSAIEAGQSEVSGRRVCRGWHGKKRLNQVRCHYELNFKVNIAYHGDEH